VKVKLQLLLFSIFFISFSSVFGQNVSLYSQFNGRYDFVFLGNTMNVAENGANDPCLILTSSADNLNLNNTDVIESAYLYWAGSGPGDLNVKLNGQDITAERTFALTLASTGLPFFSAFANVTNQVQTTGNGSYTLSDLDVSPYLNVNDYCINGTNFAGWALVVVYKNPSLPLNQLNIYDGLQNVPSVLNITLNSLNVIDSVGAKIGFVAWEGDRNISVNETLRINGTILSNPPLNPANNAFNGTNSFTGSSTLYNMDLDVYDIQNNINPGDTTAEIQLTSGQDFVMINTVITKLNSQLADATVTIDNIQQQCGSKEITIDYTFFNVNSTNALPAGTPIAIYVDGVLVAQSQTQNSIPIDGSESGQITLTLPNSSSNDYTILIVVDDDGTGNGIISEILENNNSDSQVVTLTIPPPVNALDTLISCNQGLTKGTFDFSDYAQLVLANPDDVFVGFYESLSDAEDMINPILNSSNYVATSTPKAIFVRISNGDCYTITSFLLTVRNCPPIVHNYVSNNYDGLNETFFIEGLRDVFTHFELEIYNRWGRLIWTGNNQVEDWNGYSTTGFRFDENNSPKGTYYYILNLNDPDYLEPMTGWLYYTR